MKRAQRWESRVALAMLPVGAMVTFVSAVAVVSALALAATAPGDRAGWPWWEAWCALALILGLFNTRAGIAVMSAFDWRPLLAILGRSALAVATWPDWWMG